MHVKIEKNGSCGTAFKVATSTQYCKSQCRVDIDVIDGHGTSRRK